MGELNFCHLKDILAVVHNQLISDITTDTGLPLILIRILHNKLVGGLLNSFRCYVLYLDLGQVTRFVSPFLLPFMVFALLGKWKRKLIWTIVLIYPLVFILRGNFLNLGDKIMAFKIFFMTLSLVGFVKMVRTVNLKSHSQKSNQEKNKSAHSRRAKWTN